MGEDKLEAALEKIAFSDPPLYTPDQRIQAMQALAMLRVAQEVANVEIAIQAIYEREMERRYGP